MDTAQYETDRIKLVPNKELHITPCEGVIEHYGKVLTVGVFYTAEIEYSQVEHIINGYTGAISNEWVKFCYVESPTISTWEIQQLKVFYAPKNIYLRHTTLIR